MSRYKPYGAYRDSGSEWLGSIPKHWEVKRLRHLASFANSNVDKKSHDGEQAVRLCNYTDVYYNEFIHADLDFMPATATEGQAVAFGLQAGDVIITKDSEDPRDIGIPSFVPENIPGVVCGYHLTLIRAIHPQTAQFIFRAIQSHPSKGYFYVGAPGITRFGLGQDVIGDLPVALPPVSERARIADWIQSETARIDALIGKKTLFIDLLKQKRQSAITQAVTKGHDPNVKLKDSGVAWIGEVPAHWSVSKLGYIATEQGGKTPSTSDSRFWDGGIPWVTPKDMKVDVISRSLDTITETAVSECGMPLIQPGSVLVVVRGMILAHSFPVAETAIPVTINQDMKALTPCPEVLAPYLRLLLQSAKQYVVSVLVAEAAHGTCVLRTDIWKQLPMVIPPLGEQKEILDYISTTTKTLDAVVAAVVSSITLLKERRTALITAAVTGQIDLREDIA
jgi:type I restriction enzyme, S subunit